MDWWRKMAIFTGKPAAENVPDLIPGKTNKAAAIRLLAERVGRGTINPNSDEVVGLLSSIEQTFGRPNNAQMSIRNAAELSDAKQQTFFSSPARQKVPPDHRKGLPPGFREGFHRTFATQFDVLTLQDGYACQLRDMPIAVASDRTIIVGDYSSKYAGLIYFHDNNLQNQLDDARFVDGSAVIIADDIQAANYCHWTADWLPRLAFLNERERRDVYVITAPITTQFQRESLRLCGVSEDRILSLAAYQSVRARELLVPRDLRKVLHPAHKAAPWALEYLRNTIGAKGQRDAATQPRIKLYISRRDALHRRIANEDEFIAWLEKRGYVSITPSALTVAEQSAIFAQASHVISAHGAGMTNIIFSGPGAQIVELFAPDHGTPAFYLLAAGQGNSYASYVTSEVVQGKRFQDLIVNIEDFDARCGDLL